MTRVSTRMRAEERRAAVLDAACTLFSQASYRGSTTAELARRAGVSEPVLYDHFDSKRELFLAALDEVWARHRGLAMHLMDEESDPHQWLLSVGRAMTQLSQNDVYLSNFWVQALAEASEDDAIREHLERHLSEVHVFVADVIRRCQAQDAVPAQLDADAESWIFISLAILSAVGRRLDGLLDHDLAQIRASRLRWLTHGPSV